MVRTRGGSCLRPQVRFSTPEREASAPAPAPVPALVPSPVPEAVSEEPQGFRRYQTRMGPRAPSPVPQRRVRRARPSKRARTSGLGESSSSRPPPSPVASAAEATSSPQLSPASRIRRPMFVGNPIPGNARLHRRPFHQESCYDVPALRADPRYRESMRLIEEYSLLPFMTPRPHYYPRVVLQFYQSMTSRGASVHLRFSSVSMTAPVYSERPTFQQLWACAYRRAMLRVTEIGLTLFIERWSEHWPETPLLVQYFTGGSSRLKCC